MKSVSITPEMSARFANLAVISALMVIVLHAGANCERLSSGWWFVTLSKAVAKMAVPVFFLMSGAFLAGHFEENGWWKNETLKRIRTLLVPFWVWNFLWWAYLVVMGIVSDASSGAPVGSDFGWQFSSRVFWGIVGLNILSSPFYSVTWFLRTLFVFVLISPVVLSLMRKCPIVTLVGFFIADCLVRGGVADCGFLRFFIATEGLVWFTLGIGWRIGAVPIPKIGNGMKTLLWAGWVLALLGHIAFAVLEVRLPFSWLSLIIPLSMVLLFLYVPTRRFPGWLVSSALPCYLLHMFFLSVFRIVITTSRNYALVVIGEVLFAFMGSVVFSVLIRRVGQPVGKFLFQR